jgi:glycosyltransferase involved in cell wall biosynthesis
MRAFDVMVLPSRSIPTWREQFGRVLTEAMACGTPLIGSSCGAIPEVIGDAGLIVPEEDHLALAGALDRLAGDGRLRERLSERALARTREHFDPRANLERLVDLFREALDAPQHGRA